MSLTQIEEGAWFWTFFSILDLENEGLLEDFNGVFAIFLFDKHFAVEEKGFYVFWFYPEGTFNYVYATFSILFFL